MGGYLAPFLPVHPQGITHCLYCIFAPHDLQIFFSPLLFSTIFLPCLSLSSHCVSGVLARQERQNSCGSAEQFFINQGIMQAGNSNRMQMRGRAKNQPNTFPHSKIRNLTGASRMQIISSLQSGFESGDSSPCQQLVSPH